MADARLPVPARDDDVVVIQLAYQEKVKDLFKVLADALAVGENERACQQRFQRGLRLVKRARDLALAAAREGDAI
ncbi:MAG TPA: hypothetical protein VF007_11835 [Stellaceae bacterium]